MAGAVEGSTQDGTDPACADHAHREPRRVVLARRVVECAHDGRNLPPAGWAGERVRAVAGGVAVCALRPRRVSTGARRDRPRTSPRRPTPAPLGAGPDPLGVDGPVRAGRDRRRRRRTGRAPPAPVCGRDRTTTHGARRRGAPRRPARGGRGGWSRRADPSCPRTGDPERSLVVAHEWLDVVPCTVAEVAPDGSLRELLVHPHPDSCSEPHGIGSEHHEQVSSGTAAVRVGSRVVPAVWPFGHRSERPDG